MKLSFESNLNYRQDAIQSVVGLFEGQGMEESDSLFQIYENGMFELKDGVGV